MKGANRSVVQVHADVYEVTMHFQSLTGALRINSSNAL